MSTSTPKCSSRPSTPSQYEKKEDNLRRMLTLRLQRLLVRNNSSQFTYAELLPSRRVGGGDKVYRRKVAGNLREIVQRYESRHSANIGEQRAGLNEAAMRAAFTMRERKHGQEVMLDQTLHAYGLKASRESIYNPIRNQKLEGIAEGLRIQQERLVREYRRSLSSKVSTGVTMQRPTSAMDSTELAHEVALFEEEKMKLENEQREQQELLRKEEEKKRRAQAEERVRERERQREVAREREIQRRRAVEEAAREEAQKKATPQETLYRFYEPIYRALWDMEFKAINSTNPFRVVIDANNCAAQGVPDYCTIVKKPMNLTYIRQKVNAKAYISLQEFFADVELMIKNALLYNSDPSNVYHLAAKEMNRKFRSLAKETIQSIQSGKQS